MVRGIAIAAGVLLALAASAQAQVPREYPSRDLSWTRADRDKPAELEAREAAEAAKAETACDAGDLGGCAALGSRLPRRRRQAAEPSGGRIAVSSGL